MHRNIISIVKPTRCTNVSNYIILEWHSTCFGRSFRPSSEVKTVHTARGICQTLIPEMGKITSECVYMCCSKV